MVDSTPKKTISKPRKTMSVVTRHENCGPSEDTLFMLRLFARAYRPAHSA